MDNVIFTFLSYVLAIALGMGVMKLIHSLNISKANVSAAKIIEDANSKADNLIKEAILDGKNQAYELKLEAEKEIKAKKKEVNDFENKLLQREQSIDRRDIALQGREDSLEQKANQLNDQQIELDNMEALLKEKINSKISELEKIAEMTASEAKEELFKQVEQKVAQETVAYIKEQEEEAKAKASQMAREIIATAISRYAQEETVEKTVSVVSLPSEEMKGRIIGREGRNIKAIESATGVDLIIDDTPEAITLSSFIGKIDS